ncbi:MAG: NlpC/P60 family protein [Actinomycetota bacterium]|nr:NlpC/P60 family protein [Actinomycetota bacterium]
MALLVAVSTVIALPVSSVARPTKSDVAAARATVAAAKAKLAALNDRQSLLDEQYNQAQIALTAAERKLTGAQAASRRAAATSKVAQADLSARVRSAYEGSGSEIGALLGAGSLSDFSDRLEFLNQIAADDANVVARANVAGQRAQWAAQALSTAVKERTDALASLRGRRSELVAAVGEQERLIGLLERKLHHVLYPPPPPAAIALAAPAPNPSSPAPTPAPSSTGTPPPAPSPAPTLPDPPPPSSRAQVAIQAAESVIGTPYVYAGASPQTGFDCSGLTMWAWAQAGVSLPHSSAMQYDVLPHVDRSQLQPGDLLFFYSPISHVGMYLGGDKMIHSPHTGAYVEIVDVYWQYYSGAARPG